jgi:hypothetical protein
MAAAPVELLLSANNIPFVPLARRSILANGTANWVLAWLAVVNERKATSDEWELVLSRPNRYFSNATKQWISRSPDPYLRIQESVNDGCRNVVGLSDRQKANLSLQVDQFRELMKTIEAARRFPDSLEFHCILSSVKGNWMHTLQIHRCRAMENLLILRRCMTLFR